MAKRVGSVGGCTKLDAANFSIQEIPSGPEVDIIGSLEEWEKYMELKYVYNN